MGPELARVTLARKLAARTLRLLFRHELSVESLSWLRGNSFCNGQQPGHFT